LIETLTSELFAKGSSAGLFADRPASLPCSPRLSGLLMAETGYTSGPASLDLDANIIKQCRHSEAVRHSNFTKCSQGPPPTRRVSGNSSRSSRSTGTRPIRATCVDLKTTRKCRQLESQNTAVHVGRDELTANSTRLSKAHLRRTIINCIEWTGAVPPGLVNRNAQVWLCHPVLFRHMTEAWLCHSVLRNCDSSKHK